MAQAGYTPISLYYSTTPAATPLGADLVAGELALNTVDEKLYFKNSSGTVKLLASVASTTNVASISFGTTGLTPSTATTGAITVAGTLAVANGGTGRVTGLTAIDQLTNNLATTASASNLATTGRTTIVTGTTTINSISTALTFNNGTERRLIFQGILQLTNSADLVLLGGANITTAAGDVAEFVNSGAGTTWTMTNYIRNVAP